ncbi:TRAP transporter permease [Geomicrobium sediminis]|uniref:TRAP transporter 4TM/12TM fusion protein n=1 Tax=Geomicrobium sediminis TaxID=1347788 RepID=A0ABS2P6I6_9BACL|nr:TRAP transporter fused permease subunit [Geomicrobium sediminis]MBM7630917.1 TRAP transporter 4TM/12TM fusion protein [Geomicrobium sediminis]
MKRLTGTWVWVVIIATVIGILLTINQVFYLRFLGFAPLANEYLYYIIAIFMSISFLILPARKSDTKVRFYDITAFLLTVICALYLGFNAERIILEGWDWVAPVQATTAAIILWILVLEVLRRAGGKILFFICLTISLYPLVAHVIPIYFLQGHSFDFITLANNHLMSTNSVLGIPLSTIGSLVIGFMIFGVILTHTGGGEFFFKLAQSIFGRSRGGEAKVSVAGSAFFGMLSGSAISNTVTTGQLTIPAMKKAGYEPEYAAAIEATSSTGGTITPPIMGSAVFIMASFIGVAYLEIALAAIIPAILFFLAVFLQVDAYAAKRDLKGIHKSKLPKLVATLTNGWMYLLSILALILVLIFIRSEAQAPFYASALVLVLSFFSAQAKLTWQSFKTMIFDIGKVLGEIVSLIAGIGLIVGAFSATGVSFSFSRELVQMAGDNLLLLLIAGAVTSFILGMGMTVSASYIFLAIVLAPALAQVGVNVIAAHLFVLYWATASYITPPVALASFAASSIANSNPLRTSVVSTKLGIVTFFIPFFIVYQPALIWQGTFTESVVSIFAAVAGVVLISASLSGYLVGVGRVNLLIRIAFVIGGLLMLMPSTVVNLTTIAVTVILLIIYKMIKKQRFDQSGTVDVSNS